MAEVEIKSVRSRTRITPEGQFQEYYEVEFFVDDARHKLEMQVADYTAKKAEDLVRKRAAELAAVSGKRFNV